MLNGVGFVDKLDGEYMGWVLWSGRFFDPGRQRGGQWALTMRMRRGLLFSTQFGMAERWAMDQVATIHQQSFHN